MNSAPTAGRPHATGADAKLVCCAPQRDRYRGLTFMCASFGVWRAPVRQGKRIRKKRFALKFQRPLLRPQPPY